MYEEFDVVDHEVAFSLSLLGKECQLCRRVLKYKFFDRCTLYKDGYDIICPKCKATPRLSASENFYRQREANFSSEAVRSQRREDEEDYMDRDSKGRVMHSDLFLKKLKETGTKLIVGPAHFQDEVSLYIDTSCGSSPPTYIGWIPVGYIQEFSEYAYNDYAVPTGEVKHGYRGILRNLILNGFLSERKCNQVFGECYEKTWGKAMWNYRNPGVPAPE